MGSKLSFFGIASEEDLRQLSHDIDEIKSNIAALQFRQNEICLVLSKISESLGQISSTNNDQFNNLKNDFQCIQSSISAMHDELETNNTSMSNTLSKFCDKYEVSLNYDKNMEKSLRELSKKQITQNDLLLIEKCLRLLLATQLMNDVRDSLHD